MKAETKEKIRRSEVVQAKAAALLDEYKSAGLPAEQLVQFERYMEEAKTLQDEIARERKVEDAERDLASLDRFLNEPANRLPHGANGGDDERKSLARLGWEVKNGVIHKATTLGVSVPMFPEDVLFGALPKDPQAREFYATTRAAMGEDYKQAYERLIRVTAVAMPGAAFSMLSPSEQKALSEGTDTAGGFVVPPDIQAELLARTAQEAVIRSMARIQPTNRDILRFPAVKPNAGTYSSISGASIYSSGFIGSWAGETPAFSDTDPAFQTLDIPVKKLRVATRVSNDFVNDAAVNVLAWLAMNGAENMALTEDLGFIQGDGSALQPLGVLNAGLTTVDVEGSTTDTISNTTASAGSAPKLIDLVYKLPPQYVKNARVLMRRSIEGKVRKLVDGNGRYIWPNYAVAGLTDGSPAGVLGLPVVNSDWMPDDGTNANKVVLVGDFRNYIIAQRTQITSLVLRERFADTDQTGIILYERVGGGVYNTDAFRVGIV